MALPAELENLLAFIPEEQREAERTRLTQLHEGNLRQDEFSRKMNEINEKHKKNLNWYDRANKQFDDAQADLAAARQKIEEMEAAKAAAERHRGSDPLLDPEDEGNLKVMQSELQAARNDALAAQKKIAELAGTVSEFQKQMTEGKILTRDQYDEDVVKRGNALGAAVLAVIDYQQKYRTEFNAELDRSTLINEADKNFGGNIDNAYEFLTQKPRQEKLVRDTEERVRKEEAEKRKNQNQPYDTTAGDTTLGHMQLKQQGKLGTAIPDDVKADGSGRLGTLAGAELRAEGHA